MRFVRGISHSEGPVVMVSLVVVEGAWKVCAWPVRVMERVEVGTGWVLVRFFCDGVGSIKRGWGDGEEVEGGEVLWVS